MKVSKGEKIGIIIVLLGLAQMLVGSQLLTTAPYGFFSLVIGLFTSLAGAMILLSST